MYGRKWVSNAVFEGGGGRCHVKTDGNGFYFFKWVTIANFVSLTFNSAISYLISI